MNSKTKKWCVLPLALLSCKLFCYSQISISENINLNGFGSFGYISESINGSVETDDLDIQEIILQLDFESEVISADLFFNFEDSALQIDAAVINYQIGEMVSISAGKMYSQLLYEEILLTRRQSRTHSFDYYKLHR